MGRWSKYPEEVQERAVRLVTVVALDTTMSWGHRQYLDMKLLKAEEEKRQAKAA
jgi:hypothetical protein